MSSSCAGAPPQVARIPVGAELFNQRDGLVAGFDLASGKGEIAAEEVHLAGSRNEEDLQLGALAVDDDIRRLPGHWNVLGALEAAAASPGEQGSCQKA